MLPNPIDLFTQQLLASPDRPFTHFQHRQFAGTSFFFVQMDERRTRDDFECYLQQTAKQFIEGTAWFYEYSYIRTSKAGLIYRFALRVPNEKSFCCGNLCPNCILFREKP